MRAEPPTIRRHNRIPISSLDQLATLINTQVDSVAQLVQAAHSLYTSFRIPKSTGGYREIRPPKVELREIHRKLLKALQLRVRYPRWMMGGVPKRSIFTHARLHVGREMVATFDVQAFFPSTTASMVRDALDQLGLRGMALDAVTQLVTKDNELPQGAPTSGFLANIVLEPADRRIDALCRKHRIHFTRYVDDLAVSADRDLRGFKGEIVNAIVQRNYRVAPEKIKFMGRNVPQVITKLRVNDKIRPTREFVRDVEETIWLCLNHGPQLAALAHDTSVIRLKNKLTGRIGHIAQGDPILGKKLKGRMYGVDWHRTSRTSGCQDDQG